MVRQRQNHSVQSLFDWYRSRDKYLGWNLYLSLFLERYAVVTDPSLIVASG